MMRFLYLLFLAISISNCASNSEKKNESSKDVISSEPFEHNPAISAKSILISRQASQQYQVCLSEQIKNYVNIEMDVRESTGRIMKTCDVEFNPIRDAFKLDAIPSNVTERYISSKRSRSTPNILRVLMFAQSRREQQKKTSEQNASPIKADD